MAKTYTNKLSIYLIKSEYTTSQQILKENEQIKSEAVGTIGTIHYGDSHVSPPTWVRKFFGELFSNSKDDGGLKVFGASARAVFITEVEGRVFVIAFGYGHTLLRPGICEERFGLRVFLNTVDPEHLRSIDKKNMTVVPKLSKEQMSKDSTVADFGIDVEQDLIQGMTGKPRDVRFGQTMTGKDGLSVSIKFDVHTIKDFLGVCLEKYRSDDYKAEFAFIDHITEINNQSRIDALNGQLMAKINNSEFDKVWMAIPEVIPWENVSEFRISGATDSLGGDICLPDFLNVLSATGRADFSLFENKIIDCIGASSGETVNSWRAYDCLCGEIQDSGGTCILSNGKWYQIETDFATQVDNEFKAFRDDCACSTVFPDSQDGEHEDKYNARVSRELNICNMDRNTIGSRHNQIEFCDLFTSDKKIVHVKRYGASSVLSHLFSQGLVSGELFLSYKKFRDELREKLPTEYKMLIPDARPDTTQYEIVYAIISKSTGNMDIPFFSKVNLRNAKRRLDAFGYRVSFKKIHVLNGVQATSV